MTLKDLFNGKDNWSRGLGSEVMQKFKHATNGPSFKRFLLISKLCVQGCLSLP